MGSPSRGVTSPVGNSIQGNTGIVTSLSLGASPILPNGGSGGVTGLSGIGMLGVPRRRIVSSVDSALGQSTVVSPIHAPELDATRTLNDSGFHDHQFKTSTPIHGSPVSNIKLTDGQRRSLLRQLPECLIVQLLRFRYQHGSPHKVHRPVSIPLTNLDLTQLIVDNVMKREDLTALHASYKYELYGLCLHLGAESTSYGHYIAYSKASTGEWYRFSDEVVTSVNIEYELSTRQVRENSYLLFYRKVPA